MSLATTSKKGRPSVRVVLLKEYDKNGFCFFTNLGSRKAKEIAENPFAALCFYWPTLHKQVRIEGRVTVVSQQEADVYFKTRPRGSQIAATVSKQSRILKDYRELQKKFLYLEEAFDKKNIPRPPYWGGFRLTPSYFEFWSGQPDRLHRRMAFKQEKGIWRRFELYP